MINSRTRRNIWLTLSVTSAACTVARAIRFAAGEAEWWQLATAVVTTALCVKFYLTYRKRVNEEEEDRLWKR